MISVVIMVFDD